VKLCIDLEARTLDIECAENYAHRFQFIHVIESITSICKAPLNEALWRVQKYHDKIHKTLPKNSMLTYDTLTKLKYWFQK